VGKGIFIAAVVLAMLFAVVGCGGGGGETTVSASEYKSQVTLVCNQAEQKLQELITRLKNEYQERPEKAEARYQAENLLKLIGLYEETTEELADVGVPEGGEEEAEDLIHAREESAAEVQASPLGTRDAFQVVFRDANDILKKLEANGCML